MRDALFLVWGPPGHGPRSAVFARALGIPVVFVEANPGRGAAAGMIKYPVQAVKTWRLLRRLRPSIVIVQNPPSFAPLFVGLVSSARLLIDSHSDAMQAWYWTRPRFVYRWLARRAVTTIVTNEVFAARIRDWGASATVIRDIPGRFPEGGLPVVEDRPVITVVSTFAPDEPLEEVVAAARRVPGVVFKVTGNPRRADPALVTDLPENLHLTGFLPENDYYQLLRDSVAVMCLTTRPDTMQRGACEALSLGRPIITSDTDLLRSYFSQGTVHVDNTGEGISRAVEEILDELPRYRREIVELQVRQAEEWQTALESLLAVSGVEV